MHTCIHFHRTDSKDTDIHVLDGWMPPTETHPACTIYEDGMWSPHWLHFKKKRVTYTKISPQNGEPHRYGWEHRRRRRGRWTVLSSWQGLCHAFGLFVNLHCQHVSLPLTIDESQLAAQPNVSWALLTTLKESTNVTLHNKCMWVCKGWRYPVYLQITGTHMNSFLLNL